MSLGCTSHPSPWEIFCSQHKNEQTPALPPSNLRKETLENLNLQNSAGNYHQDRDNIFVLEEIAKKRESDKGLDYLVKFENYENPVWELSTSIPPFIINYYEKTGRSKIPPARIKHTKTVGRSRKP